MPSLSSIFHRKSPVIAGEEAGAKNKAEAPPPPPPQQSAPPPYAENEQPATQTALNPGAPQFAAPQFAPGTGPTAHGQMVQANNIGVMAGGAVGWATGGSPGVGMLEGQVGANMVMQRIQQEQRHQYYREQALRYRDGLPADGVGSAGGLAPSLQPASAGRDRNRSRSQRRDERRKARWERRAKRRDGGGGVGGHEASSGSESG